ncbi:MAG: BrnT family toxin [Paracoccaceae bacterium]
MTFEWNPAKNAANIAKHGVSFEQAARIFDGPMLTWADDRDDYGEMREISIGLLDGIAMLVVAHTDRGEVTRIISARRALKHERKRYEETIR